VSLSGWEIQVDGTWYDIPTDEQEAPGTDPRLQLIEVSGGVTSARRLVFDHSPQRHDTLIFSRNDEVALRRGGSTYMFTGWIETPTSLGSPGDEKVRYECLGPKSKLNKVFWIHDGLGRVCWNLTDADDEDYDADHQDKTLYQILYQMFTDVEDDLDDVCGIDSWVLDSNMSTDAPTPENLCYNCPTGVLDIIDQAIRWLPGYLCHIVPTPTGAQLRIDKTSSLTTRTLTMGAKTWVPKNTVSPTSSGSYGALEMYGKRQQVDTAWFWVPSNPSGSTLEPLWSPSLEGSWTPENANSSEEYRKVYRAFKAKSTATGRWANANVRVTPSTSAKAWARKQIFAGDPENPSLVWYLFAFNSYNAKDRTFQLGAPAYVLNLSEGGYESAFVVMRNVVLGDAVTVREPSSGFAGDAYTIDGIETVWKKYSEKLRKVYMQGITTNASTVNGRFIDIHAGVRLGNLVGASLTFSGGTYAVTANGSDYFDTGYGSTVGAGTGYTITAIDTTGAFGEILDGIFPSLTAISYPVKQTRERARYQITDFNAPFKMRIYADDGHTTGWESLDVVVTDWTYDASSDTVELGADSEGSFAIREYEDLVSQVDIENRLEEVEIWIQRNNKGEDSDSTGTQDDPITVNAGAHDHDTNNPVELHEENTKMTDGTHVGTIAVTYDSETEEFQAQWKTGPFASP